MNTSSALDRAALVSFLAALALAASACSSKEAPPEGAASARASAMPAPTLKPSSSAPAAASAAAPKDGFVTPKWLAGVKASSVTGKPGDRVWALAPASGQETALFGVFEIDSVQGTSVTTASLLRANGALTKDDQAATKRAHTPGALISPALTPDVAKIKVGDVVIAPVFGYRTTAAHVTKIDGKVAQFKYANGEKVADESSDYAAPLAQGVAPFAYVGVKVGGALKEALVAAVAGDQVYAVDDAGNVLTAAKTEVTPLKVEWKDRKKGDAVTIFDAAGSADATVEKVTINKWVFEVKTASGNKKVPFYAVVDRM